MANKVRFLDSTPLAAFGNTNPEAFTDLLKTASLQGEELIFTNMVFNNKSKQIWVAGRRCKHFQFSEL